MKFHKDGTLPQNGEIFVFGSNLSGIHGAGAALAAMSLGAVYGVGVGPQGSTYAIPTKDHYLRVMPLDDISVYVREFVRYTKEHPEECFYVSRIGCGLAGYEDFQIAPLFVECGNNCSFAKEWKEYLV